MSDSAKKACASRSIALAALGGIAVGAIGTVLALKCGCCSKHTSSKYSLPDQPARFALDKRRNNSRVLDIDKHFDPSKLKGLNVVITGANRGLGLALAKAASDAGARVYGTCRRTSAELDAIPNSVAIEGIDVTSDESMRLLVDALEGVTVDILINNAGYFYGPAEKLDSLAFREESVRTCIDLNHINALALAATKRTQNVVRLPDVCGHFDDAARR